MENGQILPFQSFLIIISSLWQWLFKYLRMFWLLKQFQIYAKLYQHIVFQKIWYVII